LILLLSNPFTGLNQITIEAAIGIGCGLYFFARGFHMLIRKRMLINTPTSTIRSASIGLVEVSGRAVGPFTIPAPITGTPCFLYRTTAWNQSDGEWKVAAEETLHVPFFLDDGTGQLLIEPMGAELDLHRDFVQNFSDTILLPHATQSVSSFLVRHGIDPSNKVRIEERSIQPDNQLFAMGTLAENHGIEVRPPRSINRESHRTSSGGSRDIAAPAPKVVRLFDSDSLYSPATSQQSRIAAALTKAGITSPAAWNAAGVSPELRSIPQAREISVNSESPDEKLGGDFSYDPNPPVVLMKGPQDPTFLISWRSQKEVVGTLGWTCAAMIWGGGALTLFGIYVLIQERGML
jgi:E3 Ubiquitin ligase